jgi:hypothetical protein
VAAGAEVAGAEVAEAAEAADEDAAAGGAVTVTVDFPAQPAVSAATPSAAPASNSRAGRVDEVFKQILSGIRR